MHASSDEPLYTSWLFVTPNMDIDKVTAPRSQFFHLMRLSCIYALYWLEINVLQDPSKGYYLRQNLRSFEFRPSTEKYLRNSFLYWSNRLQPRFQSRHQPRHQEHFQSPFQSPDRVSPVRSPYRTRRFVGRRPVRFSPHRRGPRGPQGDWRPHNNRYGGPPRQAGNSHFYPSYPQYSDEYEDRSGSYTDRSSDRWDERSYTDSDRSYSVQSDEDCADSFDNDDYLDYDYQPSQPRPRIEYEKLLSPIPRAPIKIRVGPKNPDNFSDSPPESPADSQADSQDNTNESPKEKSPLSRLQDAQP